MYFTIIYYVVIMIIKCCFSFLKDSSMKSYSKRYIF